MKWCPLSGSSQCWRWIVVHVVLLLALIFIPCCTAAPAPSVSASPTAAPAPSVSASPTASVRSADPTPLPLATIAPTDTAAVTVAQGLSHPRLFFTAEDIDRLQTQAESTHQEIWVSIRDFVDTEVGSASLSQTSPDGDFNTYRDAGNKIIPMAFACVVSEQEEYCALAKEHLLTYAGWTDWSDYDTRNGLAHAHMVLGNALAYDWMYDRLTASEQQMVRDSLATQTRKLYEASRSSYNRELNNWWAGSYTQNHFGTVNSALGMGGLVLLGEHDEAQAWVAQAISSIQRLQYLWDGIGDGTWHEGIPYQRYGLVMALPFMTNVRSIQGTDMFPQTFLQQYSRWRVYNHLPGSNQFIMAFGDFEWDWVHGSSSAAVLRFVANEYRDGYAQWVAEDILANTGRNPSLWTSHWYTFEFLYYDPSVSVTPPDALPLNRVFPDLAAVIWRTGWSAEDMVFGLKAGVDGGHFAFDTFVQEAYPWHNRCIHTGCGLHVGHDHSDTNGFYLYNDGAWLAPEDEGNGRRDTKFHNTLLIDGQGQFRIAGDQASEPEEIAGSDGFLEVAGSSDGLSYLAADATRRYKQIGGIEDITRHVVFVRPDYFVMLDHIAANAPHTYDWVCHVDGAIATEDRWVRGESSDNQVLGIGVVNPLDFTTRIDTEGRGDAVWIRPAEAVDDVRMVHVLYPTDAVGWENRPSLGLEDDTGEGVVVNVQMNDGSDYRDDVLISYTQTATQTQVAPLPLQLGRYTFDGHAAVVRYAADGSLAQVSMYGGTFLRDDSTGRELVSGLMPEDSFDAVYSEGTVFVSGDVEPGVQVYAPDAERLVLNGEPWSFRASGDMIEVREHYRVAMPLIWVSRGDATNVAFQWLW